MSILDEVDREIDAYPDHAGLVMLVPEDRWDAFVRDAGGAAADEELIHRNVRCRKGPVTAVIAQEGF